MKRTKWLMVNPWVDPLDSELVEGPLGDVVFRRFRGVLSLIDTGAVAGWIDVRIDKRSATCVGLQITCVDIDARLLRSIRVADLVATAVAEAVRRVRTEQGVSTSPDGDLRRRHRETDPDYLKTVSKIYRSAVNASPPRHPAPEIAAEMGISVHTARKWVSQARRDGLLPQTTRGKVSRNEEQQ